jgi:hypothetical protein
MSEPGASRVGCNARVHPKRCNFATTQATASGTRQPCVAPQFQRKHLENKAFSAKQFGARLKFKRNCKMTQTKSDLSAQSDTTLSGRYWSDALRHANSGVSRGCFGARDKTRASCTLAPTVTRSTHAR